jgi:HlyD family secretion protein
MLRSGPPVRPRRDDEPARSLHEEIARLPERFRRPVVLCDLEGNTREQAARHLGWPVGTVKTRLAEARRRLGVRLTQRGVGLGAGAIGAGLAGEAAGATVSAGLAEATARAAAQLTSAGTLASQAGAMASAFL